MNRVYKRGIRIALASVALGAIALPAAEPTAAQAVRIDLPQQDLGQSLRAVAARTGWEVLFEPGDVAGRTAEAVSGDYSAPQAIAILTRGTGLHVQIEGKSIIVKGRSSAPALDAGADVSDAIVVTGTRIPGAASPSPLTVMNSDDMRSAGRGTLAEAIRDIPQNSMAGNNPGLVSGVPNARGINVGSSVSINLRGIGADATLTLLNGHRVSYNATRQGVDISSIPLLAVDRLEVVADGASAIYGSDAVAGVANIILKRDYEGAAVMMRYAGSTDGGGSHRQAGFITGHSWSTGGFMLAGEHEDASAIVARQRSYTAALAPTQTLYPSIKRSNVALAGHQRLGEGFELSVDALYNQRRSVFNLPFQSTASYLTFGAYNFPRNRSFVVAPSLAWTATDRWTVTLSGAYGRDRTHYDNDSYTNGRVTNSTRGCYCNNAQSVELGADGSLFALPGGDAKLAIGTGLRRDTLISSRVGAQTLRARQTSRYAYGEINAPLVGPSQELRFVHKLTASAAIRYENYRAIGDIATPKLGLIYEPTPDFAFKGSWGKSFKAATLFQRFTAKTASVRPIASVGGSGFPAGSTALFLTGGQPGIGPERAKTWSATLAVHPRAIEGLSVDLSYFHIDYRDRVAAPIASLARALSDPLNATFVNRAPSAADKAAAVAGVEQLLLAAGGYDPSRIVAIIDNRNRNVTAQKIEGADLQLRYRLSIRETGSLTFGVNGAYLKSEQQTLPGQPFAANAGQIFFPPHYTARGFLTWRDGGSVVTFAGNYNGDTDDRRFSPIVRSGGMTTFDLTVRHELGDRAGPFANLEIAASVSNMFNQKPDLIRTLTDYDLPYDATNNSPIGRFVSLTLTKRFP
ncbi:TonB-dependent receptor [Sphingomonas crocodyli]|uniref:TonB-dependent receptor-like protein n=1 Tax=Sphingomonas crocodyli TaxID=1979270 RepID=A0A437LY33_9SPHN|nr:TonB-dependent receptor [Sphingomonas crocodyli]RVT90328.1 TonB-dependent receptor-like protein [Sphingomonas crocodyli]